MSFVSAQDARDQVRQATEIVNLIGSQLELRRAGRNFVGRCPWHDDTKPSLQVNPERQSWKCWVCDIGGDVFSFVMQREGVDFREALKILADRAGIDLQPQTQKKIIPGSPDDKATLYQAMAWAEKLLHDCLLNSPEAEPARKYLAERHITRQSIDRFRIGFWPNEWQWLLNRTTGTPFTPAVLEACDLAARSETGGRYYDRFKGRVMFPIRDLQGRPIALGGRVLPGADANAAKYINSKETRLFTKSDNLYALEIARDAIGKSKRVTVMEGYTDVVIAHQCGVSDAVAVLGTALNERHIRLIKRFADSILLVLDGDEAGQRRTNQILDLFVAEQMDLRILTLPDELDPAEFLLERGGEAFSALLEQAVDALEHKIRIATQGIVPGRDTHLANKALEEILQTLSKAPQGANVTEAAFKLREQQILARLSRVFFLAETDVRSRLTELRRSNKPRQTPLPANAVGTNSAEPTSARVSFVGPDGTPLTPAMMLRGIPPKELELLEIFSLHPELIEQTLEQVGSAHLTSEPAQALFDVYRRVCEAGELAEFTRVLTDLEDARLKSLLVQIDDRAHAKADQASEDAPLRLRNLIRDFVQQEENIERRQQIAVLESQSLASDEEAALLKHLFELERMRRGISAPTDGTPPRHG